MADEIAHQGLIELREGPSQGNPPAGVFWNEPWFRGAYVWKWHPARLNAPVDKLLFESFSPHQLSLGHRVLTML